MNKECANCGNERIMLCPFCEHDYTDQSTLTTLRAQLAEAEKQIAARDKTIEGLREECRAWRRTDAARGCDHPYPGPPLRTHKEEQVSLCAAIAAVDASGAMGGA